MEISDVGRKLQDIVIASSDETNLPPLIAKRLLNFLKLDFTQFSLEDLADYCLVSPASLSRFIQKLGYFNYQEFKAAVNVTRQRVYKENNGKQNEIYSSQLSFKQNSQKYADLIKESIASTEKVINFDQLDKICQIIHDTDNVYLFGVHSSGDILRELQYAFLTIGKFVNYYDGRNNQKDIAKRIEDGSLIIFLSVYGNFFRHIGDFLSRIDLISSKSILITANKSIKIQKLFDDIIDLGFSPSQSTGSYQAQFLIDILFSRYRFLFPSD